MRKISLAAPLVFATALGFGQDRPAPAPPPAPIATATKGLAGVGLTQKQVDQAVERARALLADHLGRRLRRFDKLAAGKTAELDEEELLVTLALSHTDAFARDRALGAKALAGLYGVKVGKTYDSALVVLALESLGGPRHKDLIAEATRALLDVAGREAGKGWRYGRNVDHAPRTVPPESTDAADPAIEVAGGIPIYPPSLAKLDPAATGPNEDGDGSCTQFALLGLHSAAAIGVEPPAEAWEKRLEYFARAQREDGGWGYRAKGGKPYGSMTCAGIAGLAISLGHRGVARPLDDERIRRGLDWLAKRWTLEENPAAEPGDRRHHFYYLYGLERVGALLGTELIGDHEWYPEGAKYLLSTQLPNGSWKSKEGSWVHDTCFAILFLTRATTPLYGPTGAKGTLATAYVAPPAPRTGLLFILDASDSMNEKIHGRTKWEIVRDAAKKLVSKLPDTAIVGLRVYGHNPPNPTKVDESETQLLIPIGRLNREWFDQTVDAIKPKGRTPIAMSFDRCAIDLATAPPCRVLLLSDGAETGGGDPVASAQRLAADPKCLGIDCLAFDIAKDETAREQLKKVAKVGRGRYLEADDPEAMADFGAATTIDWFLIGDDGKEVARGKAGERRELAEGHYRIRIVVRDKTHERGLWINGGRETSARFHPERAAR